MALRDIKFFGNCDKNARGQVSAPYPGWYFSNHIRELRDSIADLTQRANNPALTGERQDDARRELEFKKQRLDEIMESQPKLSDTDKDAMYKAYTILGKSISDSMFTRTDMKKGFADAHEEARRMIEPILSSEGVTAVAKSMGIEPQNGKISRNQAAKMYKMMGRLLGENTNIERLRRDHVGHAYQSEPKLEEMR